MTKRNKWRFFYHYYKQKKCMSVHFRNSCTPVEHIDCRVPCETKYRKGQPHLVMQGFASSVTIKGDTAIIE